MDKQTSHIERIIDGANQCQTMLQEALESMGKVAAELGANQNHFSQLQSALADNQLALQKTADIARHIQDLSIQSKIIALNANIEASRNKAEYAGFSIIAEEIQQLAEQGGNAAYKSAQIIKNNLSAVDEGNSSARQVEESLAHMQQYMHGLQHAMEAMLEQQLQLTQQLTQFRPLAFAINLAGRQRMLSQRLVKAHLMCQLTDNGKQHRQQVRDTARLFETSLRGLRKGDRRIGLIPIQNNETLKLLDLVEQLWNEFKPLVLDFLYKETEQLEHLAQLGDRLMQACHQVVERLEASA